MGWVSLSVDSGSGAAPAAAKAHPVESAAATAQMDAALQQSQGTRTGPLPGADSVHGGGEEASAEAVCTASNAEVITASGGGGGSGSGSGGGGSGDAERRGGGGGAATDRELRERGRKAQYVEPPDEEIAAQPPPMNYRQLSEALLAGDFADLTAKFQPEELTVETLQRSGFREPVLVAAGSSEAATLAALGMRLPEQPLTANSICEAVGPATKVHTINVKTQGAGPRMTLQDWARYFATPPERRHKLLNVVSLSLAGTALEEHVVAPAVVSAIDLVATAWPPEEQPRPEVLLYALMSPGGAFTDFHVDFGGSSVWYHVVRGRKVFLAFPPTAANSAAFESWASSEAQACSFFADIASDGVRITVEAGETLLIPGGWPHAVVTPEDSVVVGGNFLHGLDFRTQLAVWDMEGRLGVALAFRYPLFKALMWHAAQYYLARIQAALEKGASPDKLTAGSLTRWEVEGLVALTGALQTWGGGRTRRGGVSGLPASIADPAGLLSQLSAAVADITQVWIAAEGSASVVDSQANLAEPLTPAAATAQLDSSAASVMDSSHATAGAVPADMVSEEAATGEALTASPAEETATQTGTAPSSSEAAQPAPSVLPPAASPPAASPPAAPPPATEPRRSSGFIIPKRQPPPPPPGAAERIAAAAAAEKAAAERAAGRRGMRGSYGGNGGNGSSSRANGGHRSSDGGSSRRTIRTAAANGFCGAAAAVPERRHAATPERVASPEAAHADAAPVVALHNGVHADHGTGGQAAAADFDGSGLPTLPGEVAAGELDAELLPQGFAADLLDLGAAEFEDLDLGMFVQPYGGCGFLDDAADAFLAQGIAPGDPLAFARGRTPPSPTGGAAEVVSESSADEDGAASADELDDNYWPKRSRRRPPSARQRRASSSSKLASPKARGSRRRANVGKEPARPPAAPEGLFKPGGRGSAALMQQRKLQQQRPQEQQQPQARQLPPPDVQQRQNAEAARLQGLLRQELTLQARVSKGGLVLNDGGARIARRIAALKQALRALGRAELADDKALAALASPIKAGPPKAKPAAPKLDMERVYSYRNTAGKLQGPFSLAQLAALAEGGLVPKDVAVTHPSRGTASLRLFLNQARRVQDAADAAMPSSPPASAARLSAKRGAPDAVRGNSDGERGHDFKRRRQWGEGGRGRGRGRGRRPEALSSQQRWRKETLSALQEEVAAAVEAEMEGEWLFADADGETQGPYTLAELRGLLSKGKLKATDMVHDEDAGMSVQAGQLLKSAAQMAAAAHASQVRALHSLHAPDTPPPAAKPAPPRRARRDAAAGPDSPPASPPAFDAEAGYDPFAEPPPDSPLAVESPAGPLPDSGRRLPGGQLQPQALQSAAQLQARPQQLDGQAMDADLPGWEPSGAKPAEPAEEDLPDWEPEAPADWSPSAVMAAAAASPFQEHDPSHPPAPGASPAPVQSPADGVTNGATSAPPAVGVIAAALAGAGVTPPQPASAQQTPPPAQPQQQHQQLPAASAPLVPPMQQPGQAGAAPQAIPYPHAAGGLRPPLQQPQQSRHMRPMYALAAGRQSQQPQPLPSGPWVSHGHRPPQAPEFQPQQQHQQQQQRQPPQQLAPGRPWGKPPLPPPPQQHQQQQSFRSQYGAPPSLQQLQQQQQRQLQQVAQPVLGVPDGQHAQHAQRMHIQPPIQPSVQQAQTQQPQQHPDVQPSSVPPWQQQPSGLAAPQVDAVSQPLPVTTSQPLLLPRQQHPDTHQALVQPLQPQQQLSPQQMSGPQASAAAPGQPISAMPTASTPQQAPQLLSTPGIDIGLLQAAVQRLTPQAPATLSVHSTTPQQPPAAPATQPVTATVPASSPAAPVPTAVLAAQVASHVSAAEQTPPPPPPLPPSPPPEDAHVQKMLRQARWRRLREEKEQREREAADGGAGAVQANAVGGDGVMAPAAAEQTPPPPPAEPHPDALPRPAQQPAHDPAMLPALQPADPQVLGPAQPALQHVPAPQQVSAQLPADAEAGISVGGPQQHCAPAAAQPHPQQLAHQGQPQPPLAWPNAPQPAQQQQQPPQPPQHLQHLQQQQQEHLKLQPQSSRTQPQQSHPMQQQPWHQRPPPRRNQQQQGTAAPASQPAQLPALPSPQELQQLGQLVQQLPSQQQPPQQQPQHGTLTQQQTQQVQPWPPQMGHSQPKQQMQQQSTQPPLMQPHLRPMQQQPPQPRPMHPAHLQGSHQPRPQHTQHSGLPLPRPGTTPAQPAGSRLLGTTGGVLPLDPEALQRRAAERLGGNPPPQQPGSKPTLQHPGPGRGPGPLASSEGLQRWAQQRIARGGASHQPPPPPTVAAPARPSVHPHELQRQAQQRLTTGSGLQQQPPPPPSAARPTQLGVHPDDLRRQAQQRLANGGGGMQALPPPPPPLPATGLAVSPAAPPAVHPDELRRQAQQRLAAGSGIRPHMQQHPAGRPSGPPPLPPPPTQMPQQQQQQQAVSQGWGVPSAVAAKLQQTQVAGHLRDQGQMNAALAALRPAPQHAALATLDSLLRLRVCKDAPAWISGELHRSQLASAPVKGHPHRAHRPLGQPHAHMTGGGGGKIGGRGRGRVQGGRGRGR